MFLLTGALGLHAAPQFVAVDDARHVCTKMLDKIEYICKKCGRLAIYDSLLCEPYPVDTD